MLKPKIKLSSVLFRASLMLALTVAVATSFVLVWAKPQQAAAATSSTLNFQARLLNSSGSLVADGNYNIEFKLYNALSSSGSTQGSCTGDSNCLWTETRTSTNQVRVVNGYMTVNLGSVTSFPTTINWDQELWLGMRVGGTGTPSWDGEMTPRLKLTAVPYALRAGSLALLTGSNTSTLGWATQTTANSILLPNEGGTICIQNSSNCGFLTSGGASGSFIQLQASTPGTAQTGNFNITGTGIAATLQATTVYGNTLDSISSGGTISIGTTNATAGITLAQNVSVSGGKTVTINGDTLIKDTSATALRVQNTLGTSTYFNVDASAGRVSVGSGTASYPLDVTGDVNTSTQYRIGGNVICTSTGCTPASGSGNYIQNTTTVQTATYAIQSTGINTTTAVIKALSGQNNDVLDIQDPSGNAIAGIESSGAIFSAPSGTSIPGNARLFVQPLAASSIALIARAAASATGDIIDAQDSGGTNTMFSVGATGNVATKTTTNSVTALQVENNNGISVLTADTTQGTNLLANPGFEVNATGWTNTTGGTLTRPGTVSNAFEGLNYGQVATTGTVGAGIKTNGTAGFASGSAPAANTYTLSFYAELATGSNAFATLQAGYNQGASDVNCTLSSTTVLTTGYQRYSCTFTTTANMSYIFIRQSDNVIHTFYADGIQLQTGSSATPYEIGGLQLGGVITAPVSLQAESNSTNAFQIQDAAGTANLFVADTLNARIGIGTATPAYKVDVVGDVNISSGSAYRINGASICTSSGCTASAASAILNQTSLQTSASFNIQGGSGNVTGVLEANGADILDLKNASAVNVATFGATGSVLLKASTDATNAFQVQQNGSSTPILDVDTSNGRVGIGQATPSRLFDVAQNSSQITAPMELLEQNGTGDATIELKSATTGTSFYVGQDTSNSGAFAVNSSTAAASNGITFVQSAINAVAGDDGAVINISQGYTSTVTAGNLLVAAVTWSTIGGSSEALTCSDGGTNTWTTVVSAFSNAHQQTTICYAIASTTTGSENITATFAGTRNFRRFVVAEYRNVATTSPVDVTSVSAAAAVTSIGSSGASSGAATTTQGGDLIFGANMDTGSAGNSTVTAGTGFTQRQLSNIGGDNDHFSVEDQVQSSAGSIAATWGETVANSQYAAAMVAFKAKPATVTDTFSSSLFTLSQSGAAKFQNSTNSTTALQIQNATNVALMTVDTTNSLVQVGSSTTDTNAVLLTLDSYSPSADPTGVAGAMYYNTSLGRFRCYQSGMWQNCIGGLVGSSTSQVTVASCTTACAPIATMTNAWAAGYCTSGRVYHIYMSGIYSATASLPTLSLGLYIGTSTTKASDTLLGVATNAATIPAAVSNLGWEMDIYMVCNSTTSVYMHGSASLLTANTGSVVDSKVITGLATTITDVQQSLYLFPAWSASSATNTITCMQYVVEAE